MTWVLDLARHRLVEAHSPAIFGVIVYTDVHANLKKLLRDEDYWRALDELSGPKWAVFSVRAHHGQWGLPTYPSGTIGMMHMVWKEPVANRDLLETFALDDTKDLPGVVVFALDGDALYRAAVRIDDSTLEATYSSLKSVFVKVAEALNRIPSVDLDKPAIVFGVVKGSLQSYRTWKRVGEAYHVLKELRDWLPI